MWDFVLFSLSDLTMANFERTWVVENDPMRTYGYKLPGYFMEYGPIEARDEEAAKAAIRQRLGVRRLPWGIQVWDLAERPLSRWKVAAAG